MVRLFSRDAVAKSPCTCGSLPGIYILDLDYSQFQAAIEFLYPEAEFSTEHGVKGEEYDNVVFVISKVQFTRDYTG